MTIIEGFRSLRAFAGASRAVAGLLAIGALGLAAPASADLPWPFGSGELPAARRVPERGREIVLVFNPAGGQRVVARIGGSGGAWAGASDSARVGPESAGATVVRR